jgi:uncharacterized membrane protein YfcA
VPADILGIGSVTLVALAAAVLTSFFVSASAGLGGSLVLVPSLSIVLGTKEGVVLAALLLGLNNVAKVTAYRRSLPFRAAALVVGLLMVGAFLGASLFVAVPERWVGIGVLASFALSLLAENQGWAGLRKVAAPVLAFGAGATSGFTGTSGPLKGAALRNLALDRAHLVGGASLASLAGDLTKSAVFAEAGELGVQQLQIAGLCLPLMVLGTWLGRSFNQAVDESRFAVLFWSVMGGYSVRVVVTLL